ncbi:MAG: hypothetical protein P8074_16855 [Anaerolineales bacterium]|jgi:hypothetical protein
MDIGNVLSRAWQIIWKHKVLWIFGILASCTSSNTFSNNISYSIDNRNTYPLENYFAQIPDWQIWLIVAIIILVVLLLVVLGIFLGTMGRIGLIRGTLQSEEGATSLTFGELFNGGLPYFWRVFGLNLIVGLALALGGILVAVIVIFATILTLGLGLICLIPALCLLAPLGWLINIFLEQANIAIVVEDLGIMDGLQRGWEVFKKNIGMLIVMGLILVLGVGLLGGFIIGLPVALFIGPAIIGAIAGTQQALQGGIAVTVLCLVFYIPVAIVLNGILQSYIRSAWTLTYLRLTSHPLVEAAPAE